MDDLTWASQHKKRIAREFIRETDFQPSDTPTGVFTAGLPGAGKTEFTIELLKDIANKPLRIDMDEIAKLIEGYKPEIADKFRAGASSILARIYDEVIKNKLDFVFDGTFAHGRALENVDRALRHGYTIKLYYIHQEPAIAWKFTQDRELVEHRAIDKTGFIDSYTRLHRNLESLQNSHKDVTISVIIKDENNKVGDRKENVDNLFEVLPPFLSQTELESVIL